MKRLSSKIAGGAFLAALLSRAWASAPPMPGTVNYVEGQVAIGAQALTEKSVGSAQLAAGQSLSTENGRAEILLTPGIFLRVDAASSLRMISPGLTETSLALEKGRAMVEVADIHKENNFRIGENGSSTQVLRPGLYEFDADQGSIRVFDGKALVQIAGRSIELKGGRQFNLYRAGKLKARKFDKKAYADDFYRWASLRSSYLAEANVDAARNYAGWAGGYRSGWYGNGWYWDPGFDAYTFIPGDGIFYDPFGWGFYSPWYAFEAPFWGYGFYGGGFYHHHFGPGYHPRFASGGGTGFLGHAHSVGVGGRTGAGGFGGSHSFGGGRSAGGGVRAGGGFHGGGGGFHGGGGGHGGGGHGGGGHGGGGHGR